MALPDPAVTIRQVGHEGEPLVVIDGFSGMVDTLLAGGRSRSYQQSGDNFYPGIRALVDPSYLDRRRGLLESVLNRVFGFTRGVELEMAAYSLVTTAEQSLTPLQRIPHYDDPGSDIIAVMHYLLPRESGGTAFYRHLRTGFEAITPEREQTYRKALVEDDREFGPAPPRYCHGDSERYEMIAEVVAHPDRMLLYHGRLLHSGVIPDPAALTDDPFKGRLTINMFLRGR